MGLLLALRSGHGLPFPELVVDGLDPEALAALWAAVLDYRVIGVGLPADTALGAVPQLG